MNIELNNKINIELNNQIEESNRVIELSQHLFEVKRKDRFEDYNPLEFHIDAPTRNTRANIQNLDLDIYLDKRLIRSEYDAITCHDSRIEFYHRGSKRIALPIEYCQLFISNIPLYINYQSKIFKTSFQYESVSNNNYLLIKLFTSEQLTSNGLRFPSHSFGAKFLCYKIFPLPYYNEKDYDHRYLVLGHYQTLPNKKAIDLLEFWLNQKLLENS